MKATTSPEDIATFIDLEKSLAGLRTYFAMTNEAEARDETQTCTVYFVKQGDEVVGSVIYKMESSEHAHIDGLAMKPEYQGQGLGRAALQKVLDELQQIPHIDLDTHPENENAIKLYESLGFERGEIKENAFGDNEPRMLMTLKK